MNYVAIALSEDSPGCWYLELESTRGVPFARNVLLDCTFDAEEHENCCFLVSNRVFSQLAFDFPPDERKVPLPLSCFTGRHC